MEAEDNLEARAVKIQASATLGPMQASGTVKILPIDRIEVEDADTMQYLRLRNGDLELRQKLFAIIDQGERILLTQESLPD